MDFNGTGTGWITGPIDRRVDESRRTAFHPRRNRCGNPLVQECAISPSSFEFLSFVRSFVRSFFLSISLKSPFSNFAAVARPPSLIGRSVGRDTHTHTHTHTEGDQQKPTENEKKKENGREREKKKEGAGRRRGQSARLIGPSFIYSFIYVLI